MNNLTQRKIILQLLKEYPEGINSVWIRENFYIVDVATRIFELKDEGYTINKRREKNGTATYFLEKEASNPIVEPQKEQMIWMFEGDRAYQVPMSEANKITETNQESLF